MGSRDNLSCCFVRRELGRDEDYFRELKLFVDLFCRSEMPGMDRIKCAAEEADPYFILAVTHVIAVTIL